MSDTDTRLPDFETFYGGFALGYSLSSYARKAKFQLDAATQGNRLDRCENAGNAADFWAPATNARDAYLRVAFWLAVAAQCCGSNALVNYAHGYYNKGTDAYVSGDPVAIYQQGASILRSASSDASARGIAALLHAGNSGSVAAVKQAQKEASPVGIVSSTLQRSASDSVSALEHTRGLVTGEKPRSVDPRLWFLRKWGWRIGLGLVLIGGVFWLGRPYIKALNKTVSPGE